MYSFFEFVMFREKDSEAMLNPCGYVMSIHIDFIFSIYIRGFDVISMVNCVL